MKCPSSRIAFLALLSLCAWQAIFWIFLSASHHAAETSFEVPYTPHTRGPAGGSSSQNDPFQAAASRAQGTATPNTTGHAYLALCSIFKNEHGNLQQWIQYHRWLGVGKFYVFDHGSSPPLSIELESFVHEGLVEVFYFAGDSWLQDAPRYQSSSRTFLSPQAWAYDSCFRWFGARHTFMGMLDSDEFIVLRGMQPGQQPSLSSFLKPFEAHGGLVVQWQLMGPSGHSERPQEEAMLAYTACIPRAALQAMVEFQQTPYGHTKSFTNTRHYRDGCDPHQCALDAGAVYVNEDRSPISEELVLEVRWSRIVVQHYVTRSIEEYEKKMQRGSGHSQYSRLSKRLGLTSRGWQYFLDINDLATDVCEDGAAAFRSCCAAHACTCTASLEDDDADEPATEALPM